eukprot:TRINITY_DN58927_c0_g3_i1.p1 TRINITY_DN58927_c0_g3~~TRINITY_DN58927_c0_g3_i1.p1  ORF type:complete len:728 (+),score=33.06 TRINITY_DN58927_c0_g3_i1:68-2251(+)
MLWTHEDLTFSSNFDSGNLSKVEALSSTEFNLWTSPDCEGSVYETQYTTWFYFSVKGAEAGQTLTFNLLNLNAQAKLYSQDMRPVVCSHPSAPQWVRIPGRIAHHCPKSTTQLKLTFNHTFEHDNNEVFFAFTYPYSYKELQEHLANWETVHGSAHLTRQNPQPQDVYFVRETLLYTLEGRKVDLLTISNRSGMSDSTEPQIGPNLCERTGMMNQKRPYLFPNKKIFYITARVHPGEVPSSHLLHGFIEFILSNDPRAHAAREHFVFKIIPMLNPDGVARGHYRLDTQGVNLNRSYVEPDVQYQPTIYAAKEVFLALHQTGKLVMYVDLHGHATRRGCFIYGNALTDSEQIDNLLYPKLVSLNTPYFDFSACNFTEKNMKAKDKRDGLSKEGSGRVRMFVESGLVHCYTLECNYNTMITVNRIAHLDLDNRWPSSNVDRLSHCYPHHAAHSFHTHPPKYTPALYQDVGRALVCAVLDLHDINPHSRLPHSLFGSTKGVRAWVERNQKLVAPVSQMKKSTAAMAKLTLNESGFNNNSNLNIGTSSSSGSGFSSMLSSTLHSNNGPRERAGASHADVDYGVNKTTTGRLGGGFAMQKSPRRTGPASKVPAGRPVGSRLHHAHDRDKDNTHTTRTSHLSHSHHHGHHAHSTTTVRERVTGNTTGAAAAHSHTTHSSVVKKLPAAKGLLATRSRSPIKIEPPASHYITNLEHHNSPLHPVVSSNWPSRKRK